MKFGLAWNSLLYNCFLTVYNGDGSVAITHGGIEIGQGIDMKVRFSYCVAAYISCVVHEFPCI